jgi:hypothetical protein
MAQSGGMPLVLDHYATLRNNQTQRLHLADIVVYMGGPAAAAAWSWIAGLQAQHLPEILGAVAILTGLIFNVFVLLFDLTMRAADPDRTDPARRGALLKLAEQLRANISYAVLVGILMTALVGVAVMLSDSDALPIIPSAILVFGGSQMLLTIFMVLKRVRALYRAFLEAAPDRVP